MSAFEDAELIKVNIRVYYPFSCSLVTTATVVLTPMAMDEFHVPYGRIDNARESTSFDVIVRGERHLTICIVRDASDIKRHKWESHRENKRSS